MSKNKPNENIVDMALRGKTPNLNGISAETIKNNFDKISSTTKIVDSINKNKDMLREKRKEVITAYGLAMVALGATIVLSFFSKTAGYVFGGLTTVIGLVGLDPYLGLKKSELYNELSTDYVINNRTK